MSKAENFEKLLAAVPVMPVVTIVSPDAAADLARALLRGGLGAMEVTLRTPAALAAIAAIANEVPDIAVGAGTVLSRADLTAAADAGASFAISPGSTPGLLTAGRKSGIPYLPGIASASEIQMGMDAGYSIFKFFPAGGAGGLATLRAFAAPFPQLRFCATGGIAADTAQSYLDLPNVLSVGGSWIAPTDLIARREWSAIETRARDAATCFKRKPTR